MLEKFYGQRIKTACSDKIVDHRGTSSLIIGVLVLVFGLFSFALGIAAICIATSASFIGYGIWCGFIFVISGIIYIATFSQRKACLMTVAMVFGLISIFCAVVEFSLGIVGTEADSKRQSYLLNWTYGGYAYDIFNSRNVFLNGYCTGQTNYGFSYSWAPVNILLLISGFIELVLNCIGVGLIFVDLCSGTREIIHYSGLNNQGFSQADMESVVSRPPVYKVYSS